MMIHLCVENPFGQGLLQILKQTVGIKGAFGIGAGQQLIEEGVGDMGLFASRHRRAPLLQSCPTPHEIPDSSDRRPGMISTPVVLVLDNGPIHTSKASRAALAARAHWLTVEWLPKYAPELNDI